MNRIGRRPRARCFLASSKLFLQVGHAGHHRRQRHQRLADLLGQQPRQRGLAAAGRPPQDQRRQPPPLQHPRQRRLRPQKLLLPDQLAEHGRPEPVGKRPVRCSAWRGSRQVGIERREQVGHEGSLAGRARPVCGRRLDSRVPAESSFV